MSHSLAQTLCQKYLQSWVSLYDNQTQEDSVMMFLIQNKLSGHITIEQALNTLKS